MSRIIPSWAGLPDKPSIGDLAGVLPLDKLPAHSHSWSDLSGLLPLDKLPAHTHDDRYTRLSGGNTISGDQSITGNITASGNINAGFVANTPEQSNIAGTKLGSTGNGPWIRGSGEAAYTISRTNSQASASLYFYSFSNETVQVFGRLGIGGIIQAPQSFLTAASNTLSLWQSDGTTAGNLNLATLTASGNITAIHLRGTALWIGGGTNSRIYGPASGQFVFYNGTETSGVGIDVTTDGVLSVRNKAQNAGGNLACNGISASGQLTSKPRPATVAPNTTDLPSGFCVWWHDTVGNARRFAYNDGGLMHLSPLLKSSIPATPSDLAGVISVLQHWGLCA